MQDTAQVIVNSRVGGGLMTRVATNDEVLADALKPKGDRRRLLAPNMVVSLAVEVSMDLQEKSKAQKEQQAARPPWRRPCAALQLCLCLHLMQPEQSSGPL